MGDGSDKSDDMEHETIRLELDEIEQLKISDAGEDLVQTLEMESSPKEWATHPIRPTLDKTTARFDVPPRLLALARSSRGLEPLTVEGWIEFVAFVDADGSVQLPESFLKQLGPGPVRVRVRQDDD